MAVSLPEYTNIEAEDFSTKKLNRLACMFLFKNVLAVCFRNAIFTMLITEPMDLILRIDESQRQYLEETYQKRLEELTVELNSLSAEIQSLQTLLVQIKSQADTSGMAISKDVQPASPSRSPLGYIRKWPWIRKIGFILMASSKPITTKEIVDTLISDYEPNLLGVRKSVVASISAVLSVHSKEGGKFLRTITEFGEYAYEMAKK